jgi:rubrerythrin
MELKEVINAAIRQEESSYKLYNKALKMTTNPGAQSLFKDLANQELHHKELLQKAKAGDLQFPDSKFNQLKFDELLLTPLNELKEIDNILKFAVKKEVRAFKQYTGLAKVLPYGDMRTLFEKLAGEEQKHKHMVENLKSKLF